MRSSRSPCPPARSSTFIVRRRRRACPTGATPSSSTPASSQSIVVERALTRTIDDIPTTSVAARSAAPGGRRSSPTTWTLASGRRADEDALVVYNVDNVDATVTVQAVRRTGSSTCRRWPRSPCPPGGLITIALTEPDVLDTPADPALDVAGVRRALAAARAGDRRAAPRRGRSRSSGLTWTCARRSRRRSSSSPSRWSRSSVRRRRPDAADAAGARVPDQLDRSRLRPPRRPVAGRRVHLGDLRHVRRRGRQGARCWRAPTSPSSRSSISAPRPLHERYAIDAVPTLVVADAEGVVRASSSARSAPPTSGRVAAARR